MKLSHNPHASWTPPSAAVDDNYEAEVQRTTRKAEAQFRQAQRRLERAEGRLMKAREGAASQGRRRHLADLERQVELRRAELEEYRRLMTGVVAGAEHRGTRSFRPVPPSRGSGV